jgi:perosamine synthetase
MILLSAPNIAGNEWKYIKDCLDTGWVSSVGSYVTKFEQAVANYTGAGYAIACVNGTNALHIALLLQGVGPGDLVIVPNITFIASVNAIRYCGANPVLVDVDENSWQMDCNLLQNFLEEECQVLKGVCTHKISGKRVAALLPVHVLGNMVDMEALSELALKFHIPIVEDATESLGSFYNGKHSGTFGKMGCFSFNGNKIITTGGGGMIVTNDERLAKKAKHLTTQAKSDAFEYIHDEVGYNYRMVNLLAAMGLAQMEQLEGFIETKKKINEFYRSHLQGLGDIQFQKILPGADINFWLFTFKTRQRQQLLDILNESGIQARPFWKPMNQLPMFATDFYLSDTDVSDRVYRDCVSIPSSTFLMPQDLKKIMKVIQNHFHSLKHDASILFK